MTTEVKPGEGGAVDAGAAGAAGAGNEQAEGNASVLGGASEAAAGGGNDAGGAGQETNAGAGGDDKGGEQKGKPAGAPEKYDIKLPEGFALSDEMRVEYETFSRRNNLTQEEAQAGMDQHLKMVNGLLAQIQKAGEDQRKSMHDETMKHLGADAQKKLANVAKMIDKYGTPELRKYLNESGAGDHVEVVKLMQKLAEAMSPDTLVQGKPSTGKKSPADVMFPSTYQA